jgi:hypothetical protein
MKNVKIPTSDSWHNALIESLRYPKEPAAYIRPLACSRINPPQSPLARGEEILLPLHPSLSPLLGEKSKDEAFYSREGWGGVSRIYARGLLRLSWKKKILSLDCSKRCLKMLWRLVYR